MSVFITSSGRFLPGPPIDNERVEHILGFVDDKPSRFRRRVLAANGIATRHYAIDEKQQTTISNEAMAVAAARACLDKSSLSTQRVKVLSCATSQGDLVLPGFASMVQAGLGLTGVELHTSHGICSSSMMALKAAANTIRVGDQSCALVVASELSSRLLKRSRYEAAGGHHVVDARSEFLRWMLSDGAGAVLLQDQAVGTCLRMDWVRSFSHAESYPLCMTVGVPADEDDCRTWQDFDTFADAEAAGALLLRQEVRLLDTVVKLGVDGALRLMAEGVLDLARLDHFLCHFSSQHFVGRIVELLQMAGASIAAEKWYTNLYHRGNTGCASIFIMLDEFLETKTVKPGETMLCMVPESGRFNTAYAHFTVVDGIDNG